MRLIYLLASASALSAFLLAPAVTHADVIDFNGNGTTWATGTNWVNGIAPANDLTTDIARFNQISFTNQPGVGTTRSVAGIIVGDSSTATAALTISGTTLSLGASGLDVKAAAGAVTLSPTNLTLGANQTWANSSSSLLTVTSAISGAFSLEKTGSGALSLTGGTYSGGFTLTDGNLRLNGNSAAGTGTLALNGGILSTSGSSSRTLTNTVTVGGDVQLGVAGISGITTLGGAITVNGNRQLSFVNTGVTLTGSLTLNGNLTLATDIASQLAGGGNVLTGIIGEIGDARSLTKTGTGIIVLSGENTYSGGTTLTSGQIYLDATAINTTSTALGTGTVTINGGTLDLRGRNLVINALAGSGGAITDTASNGTRTLTVGQGDGGGAFSGAITQSSSAKIIALTKTGSGTQKFSGANTYIGQTLVNAGTLLINGTHADGSTTGSAINGYGSTTSGHFQVASGATLGGSGSIKGNTGVANSNLVFVQSGGHLAPGDASPGTLTFDGASISGSGSRVLNMASGAVFDFQLSGTGDAPDQLAFWNYVSGDLLLNGNTLNLSLSGPQTAGTYTVDLVTFFSNSGSSIAATTLSSGLVLGTLGSGISSATINYNLNTIGLTYTVTDTIPEPATFAVIGGLAALLLAVVSRRRTT